ncbi:MAG: hypothetical protein XD88_1358 [Methanocalculus sp. 52_23]|nr:MAG: hypothetical protein XD88_1358 [Methanocalculus sp. 52_23]
MLPAGFRAYDEVGDQENADNNIRQEIGDVSREVAGQLGGKTLVGFGFGLHGRPPGE